LFVATISIALICLTTFDFSVETSFDAIASVNRAHVVIITINESRSATDHVIASVCVADINIITTIRVVGIDASLFLIARRSLAGSVIVTNNLNIDASNIGMAVISGACVIIIAVYVLVLATFYRIAGVNGTIVAVVAIDFFLYTTN